MFRYLVAIFMFFTTLNCQGQVVHIYGVLTETYSKEKMCKADVVIYHRNGFDSLKTSSEGRFECFLSFNDIFLISLGKKGFYSKNLVINTLDLFDDGAGLSMNVDMNLIFASDSTLNGIFEEPIGKARYDHDQDGLAWDLEYIEKVQESLDTLIDYLGNNKSKYLLTNKSEAAAKDCSGNGIPELLDFGTQSHERNLKIYESNYGHYFTAGAEYFDRPSFGLKMDISDMHFPVKQIDHGERKFQKVLERGESLLQEGKYDEAFELFERAHVSFPNSSIIKKKIKKLKKLIEQYENK
ncbi:MAG: hypothetical protein AAF487_06955 [Bacteroidota bacterium]